MFLIKELNILLWSTWQIYLNKLFSALSVEDKAIRFNLGRKKRNEFKLLSSVQHWGKQGGLKICSLNLKEFREWGRHIHNWFHHKMIQLYALCIYSHICKAQDGGKFHRMQTCNSLLCSLLQSFLFSPKPLFILIADAIFIKAFYWIKIHIF